MVHRWIIGIGTLVPIGEIRCRYVLVINIVARRGLRGSIVDPNVGDKLGVGRGLWGRRVIRNESKLGVLMRPPSFVLVVLGLILTNAQLVCKLPNRPGFGP